MGQPDGAAVPTTSCMTTKERGTTSGVQLDYYMPAMPRQTGEPGLIERFVKGLDKGPRL